MQRREVLKLLAAGAVTTAFSPSLMAHFSARRKRKSARLTSCAR